MPTSMNGDVQGTVARDTAWGMGTEGVRLAASLGAFYLLTTTLGPADYGLFAGLQAFAAILGTLSGTCIAMLLLQESIRERRSLDEVLPMALGLALAGGIILVPCAAVVGSFLLTDLPMASIALFAAGELLGASAVHVSAGALQSRLGFAAAAPLRTAFHGLRLVVVAALWLAGSLSLPALVVALTAYDVAAGVVSLTSTTRRLDVRLGISIPRWWELRRGLSYSATVAGFGVQEDSDKALVVRFAGALDAGVYAAGYRAAQLATAPIRAMVASSHNRFLEHQPMARGEHVRRSLRYTAASGAYGLTAMVALLACAPLVEPVLGERYAGSVDVVRFVAPLVLLRSLSLFPFNGLMGLGRNGVRSAIVGSSAVLNVTASAALIPSHSWRGAAAATIGSEVVFLVLTWAALLRCQRRHDRAVAEPARVLSLVAQGAQP